MAEAAKFDLNDDGVVVIVGTGAGGGVLANELAQKGIKVVALEAGGRYLPEDYGTTNGKVSGNWPGPIRARPAATGGWPRIFRACRPGS
jgi:choline dehydrogenase-like flavoprotein